MAQTNKIFASTYSSRNNVSNKASERKHSMSCHETGLKSFRDRDWDSFQRRFVIWLINCVSYVLVNSLYIDEKVIIRVRNKLYNNNDSIYSSTNRECTKGKLAGIFGIESTKHYNLQQMEK